MSSLRRVMLLAVASLMVLGAAPARAKSITIGVSMQGLKAPYVVSVKKHLEAAFAAQYPGVKVMILDGEADANKQVSQVENFIAQGVDGIILNPIAYDGCSPAVAAAAKAKIPIVTLITRVANQDLATAWVGSDHKDSGIIEATMMAKDMGGKGQIVTIEGEPGIDAQIQRTLGYKEVLAKNPGIKILATQPAYWDRDKALKLVENWLQADKDFTVVLSQNDNMAMGALKAVEDAGKASKISVYGIDGDVDCLIAVRDGKIKGTVFQDAKAQAETAAKYVMMAVKGEKVPKLTAIPFLAVTKSNVDQFLK